MVQVKKKFIVCGRCVSNVYIMCSYVVEHCVFIGLLLIDFYGNI